MMFTHYYSFSKSSTAFVIPTLSSGKKYPAIISPTPIEPTNSPTPFNTNTNATPKR